MNRLMYVALLALACSCVAPTESMPEVEQTGEVQQAVQHTTTRDLPWFGPTPAGGPCCSDAPGTWHTQGASAGHSSFGCVTNQPFDQSWGRLGCVYDWSADPNVASGTTFSTGYQFLYGGESDQYDGGYTFGLDDIAPASEYSRITDIVAVMVFAEYTKSGGASSCVRMVVELEDLGTVCPGSATTGQLAWVSAGHAAQGGQHWTKGQLSSSFEGVNNLRMFWEGGTPNPVSGSNTSRFAIGAIKLRVQYTWNG